MHPIVGGPSRGARGARGWSGLGLMLGLALVGAVPVAGCGSSQRETGTTVQVDQEKVEQEHKEMEQFYDDGGAAKKRAGSD